MNILFKSTELYICTSVIVLNILYSVYYEYVMCMFHIIFISYSTPISVCFFFSPVAAYRLKIQVIVICHYYMTMYSMYTVCIMYT
jgi:hypothetical protein